jgi:hypothetical protein
MTREEIEKKITNKKLQIRDIREDIMTNGCVLEQEERNLADLEKQLAELEVEVYEPMLLTVDRYDELYTERIKRHNAGEELKKLISEENAKQGWKVDWNDDTQSKFYLNGYFHKDKEVGISYCCYQQLFENELYFSEQSSQNQDFLEKIKPLWLRWKGIK